MDWITNLSAFTKSVEDNTLSQAADGSNANIKLKMHQGYDKSYYAVRDEVRGLFLFHLLSLLERESHS